MSKLSGISMEGQGFTEALLGTLTSYTADVANAQKKAIRKTANEVKKIVSTSGDYKNHSGDYRSSFGTKVKYEDDFNLRIHVYAAKKHQWCLTHLIENGHLMPDGSRSKAYPHMIDGKNYVKEMLDENIREEVEKI